MSLSSWESCPTGDASCRPTPVGRSAVASSYMSAYRRSGQFVLSRTNHHWHPKDSKTGERTPLNACIAKAQKKKKVKECKHGAPWTKQCTRRTKLVCAGVARKHHLKVTGQRNALGSFLIRRTDEWSRC